MIGPRSAPLCETPDQPMRTLEEQCSRLGSVLQLEQLAALGDSRAQGWSHAGDWLDLAAGVVRVEIVTRLFDDGPVYCEALLEFEKLQSKAVSDYSTELTRFLFAWGALETIVDVIVPPSERDSGKIKAVGRLLARAFEPDRLPHYGCAIARLRHLLSYPQQGLKVTDSDFLPDDCYGESGIGIRIVYRLRNHLSHGSLTLHSLDPEGSISRLGPEIAKTSTLIVLLTVQMLLIAHFGRTGIVVKAYNDDCECDGVRDLCDVVRRIHLKSAPNFRL
jgi:hypothetical protein